MKRSKTIGRRTNNSFALFDELSRMTYDMPLAKLLTDRNTRRRNQRVRQLMGVAMKKDFSTPRRKRDARSPTGFDVKWKIDPIALKRTPASHWALQVLDHSPDRRPKRSESAKGMALRLRRETVLSKAYQRWIRPYICKDPAMRDEIRKLLEEFCLGEYTDHLMIDNVIEFCSEKTADLIALKLIAHGIPLPPKLTDALGKGLILLATLGQRAICSSTATIPR